MRIALTGSDGQLGRAFQDVAREAGVEVVALRHGEGAGRLDLTRPATVMDAVAESGADWVLHAAAMTDVDGCERNPALAHAVNALGSQAVARAAKTVGARLVVVSTDYVYDGTKGPYRESDTPNPVSEYGRSKLEGERLAQAVLPACVVARTSVVFGPHKKNFVTWLLGELRAGRGVRIVRDQRVNPTFAYDLAEQVLALMRADARGVYHTAGASSLSRLEMAYAIADHFGLDRGLITPIASSDLTWVARRPMDATLDVTKLSQLHRPLAFTQAIGRLQKHLAG